MTLMLYPKGDLTNIVTIDYHYEAQANGQAGDGVLGTDSTTGCFAQRHQPLARDRPGPGGRDRGERHGRGGDVDRVLGRLVQVEIYDDKPWAMPPDPITTGDPALCPDISTL